MPPIRHTDRTSGDSVGWTGRFVSDDTPQWARDHIHSLDAYGGAGGGMRGRGGRIRRGHFPTRAMNARNFRASRLREEQAAKQNGADDLREQGGVGGQAVVRRQARPMTVGGGELVCEGQGDVDMGEGGDNHGDNGENAMDMTGMIGPAPRTPAAPAAAIGTPATSRAATPRTNSPVNLLLAQSRALNRSIEAVAAENEAFRASMDAHEVEKETWQADRDAMETENERLTTQIQDQTQLDQEVAVAQQQVQDLEAQLAAGSTEQRRLEAQIQGLDMEKQQLQAQNSTLSSTLSETDQMRDSLNRQIDKLQTAIREHDAVVRRYECSISQLEEEKFTSIQTVRSAVGMTEKLNNERETLRKAKKAALEGKKTAERKMENAVLGHGEALRDRDAAIRERDESLKKQAETQAAKEALEKQLHVVQREKAQATEKLAFIKTTMAAL